MSMRALPLLAALLLGAATALLVSCGGNDGRIPSGNASSLERELNDVRSDFENGRCDAAQQAVSRLNGALVNLPDSVDSSLRNRLRSGIANLDERVAATCGQTQQTQTQQQTQTEQQTQTKEQTDTETETNTDTETTGTETTGTENTGTQTGTTGTGTTETGTTGTGPTDTGTTDGGGGTGGAPSAGGGNG